MIMKKGAFITIYGINNIGKSTHVRILVDRLRKEGYSVVALKYPVYDLEPTGPFINRVLRKGHKVDEMELQMWFALNRYQFESVLKRWLSEGKIVIAEDYTGTGIAWGTAKGADEKWLIQLNRYLLKENLALLLEGKRFLHSKEKGHIHESDDALVEKTRRVFLQLAKKYRWRRVRVEKKKEETSENIYKVVKKFLTSRARRSS